MNDYVTLKIYDPATEDPSYKASASDIVTLVKEYSNPVGIEIGVDEGSSTYWFLKSVPSLTLHGIDPYAGYIDWNGNDIDQDNRNRVRDGMINKISEFSDRFTLHQKTSDSAVEDFKDGEYDFIFIDGLHEYDQVLKDCRNYYSKIKSGGVFSGHDYKVIAGVTKAVDEFAAEVGIEVKYLPNKDVWYWIKP